jgi:hypothetical protein
MRAFVRKSDNHTENRKTPFFPPVVQPKIEVGAPDDQYEQEADKVAAKVVDNSSGQSEEKDEKLVRQKPIADTVSPYLQKQSEEEEKPVQKQEEEPIQNKENSLPGIQSIEENKQKIQNKQKEETVQMKEEEEKIQNKATQASTETPSLSPKLKNSKGGGSPLSKRVKTEMETGFGADFSHVKIHTGTDAIHMSKQLHAQAFTNGSNIYFNKGKFNPTTREGKKLLAHELTHTIQQGGKAENSIQRSPLSDELELLWESGNKAAFFDRLRIVSAFDFDLYLFVANDLSGDDYWLAHNILLFGPENSWPIHLRVEREMKGWADCGGKGRVFDILRTSNGTDSSNGQLLFSLTKIFSPGTDDIWLATNLMQYGVEARWPVHLRIERAMKGWADCNGASEVHEILRSVNGAEASNFRAIFAIFLYMALATKYDRWLALQLLHYGVETNFPMHVGIMNFFYSKGDEGPINTILSQGYTIKTFTGAFDTWQYHSDGRIEEVDISTNLLGNTDSTIQTIRLNSTLSADSASMTLFHELNHVTSTEPDYLEQEIQVRIQSEQYAIDHGLPPTGTNTRKSDGTVNDVEIRRQIMGSTHYNPTDKTRIGRRYSGEAVIGPWALPI